MVEQPELESNQDEVQTGDQEEAPFEEQEDQVATSEASSGEITAEALPLFEQLYAEDTLKDFKLDYATKQLALIDQVVALMPQEMKDAMFTYTGDDIEKLLNESLANKGKTNYLIEKK